MKIGVTLPIGENPETGQAPAYADIRAFAQQAEQLGCDSVWIFDHLLFRPAGRPEYGIWEAWTILSAIAEATARVELGTLVLCTAFRNPALLAKMAATLDEISGGRLILGLGAGWHAPEFEAFGYPFDQRVSRFAEALQIIVPLLREGRVDVHGEYYSAANCVLRPRGPRPSGIPILLGAFGPRMLQLTAQYADAWNTCWHGRVAAIAENRAKFEAACRDAGRDPQTVDITVGVSITCPPRAGAAPNEINPNKTLAGSVDEVAAALRAYADVGVAHLICNLSPMNAEGLAWFGEVLRAYGAQPAQRQS